MVGRCDKGTRRDRDAGDARGPQLISVPRKEGAKRVAGETTGRREGGGRSRGCGRGSDLHKYIEFIEMSLGIAARRILAAYQPPRRFIPSSILPSPAIAADALLCCCSLLPLVVVLSRIY